MASERGRDSYLTEQNINGLTPQELDFFCHEIRRPLTAARGFLQMANNPSISEGEMVEGIGEMLVTTTRVGDFITGILNTGQKQLIKELSLGSTTIEVKGMLQGIVGATLFPAEAQEEERNLWAGMIDEARTSWDYLEIIMGLLDDHLSKIVATGREVLKKPHLSKNQQTWLLTSIERLEEASSLSFDLGAINDPDLLRQRIEEGMTAISLAQLEEVIETAKASIKLKEELKIDVVNSIDSQTAIRAHRFFLTLVLGNLLDNLSLYGRNAAGVPHGVLTIEEQKGMAVFSLQDEGKGIGLEEREIIFEKGRRGRAGEGTEGTGLGLSVTKRVIEAHGGQIWVESAREAETDEREYKGSTFIFTLPFAEQES